MWLKTRPHDQLCVDQGRKLIFTDSGSKLKVKEQALTTMVGFVITAAPQPLAELIARFTTKAQVKIPKKIRGDRSDAAKAEKARKRDAKRTKAIAKRHAGVLGLAAVVLAFPYTMPPVLPAVLVCLSERLRCAPD